MDKKNMLSQQEIDALLANDGFDDGGTAAEYTGEGGLSGFEVDALGEIGNITFGNASTALSTILGQKVEITTPQVELVAADELNVEFPKPHVAVSVKYTEGFSGTNMLVIKTMDAAVIADLMMGGSGQVEDDTLSDLHTSAVQEAMNQMMGSAATSMSTIFDTVVNISPPTVNIIDFAGSEKPQHELEDEMLVKIAFRLTVGDLIDSYIMQLLPFSFAKEMTEKLSARPSAVHSEEQKAIEETAASAVADAPPGRPPRQADQLKREPQHTRAQPSGDTQTKRPYPSREVQTAEFAPLIEEREEASVDFDLFMDIPLQVTVELGRTEKSIQELLSLSPGSVIELDKLAGEPVDILVNRKLIARGEVVVVDENFGVRVTDIYSKKVRFEKLQ